MATTAENREPAPRVAPTLVLNVYPGCADDKKDHDIACVTLDEATLQRIFRRFELAAAMQQQDEAAFQHSFRTKITFFRRPSEEELAGAYAHMRETMENLGKEDYVLVVDEPFVVPEALIQRTILGNEVITRGLCDEPHYEVAWEATAADDLDLTVATWAVPRSDIELFAKGIER